MLQNEEAEKNLKDYNSAITPFVWQAHCVDCTTCSLLQSKKKGGRPPKCQKNRGRRKGDTAQNVTRAELKARIKFVAGPCYKSSIPLGIMSNSPSQLASLLCPVCSNVPDDAIETTCGHIVCATCCSSWLDESKSASCPACHAEFHTTDDIKKVSPVVNNILDKLLKDHVSACHPPYIHISPQASTSGKTTPAPLSPSKISAIISQPLDRPLSEPETRCATHLIRRMLQSPSTIPTHTEEKEQQIDLELPTGGQPLCFKRIPKPRKPSNEVHRTTLRKRSKTLSDYREILSGGEKGAQKQLTDELKITDAEVRKNILKEAGITPEISAGEGLAMKADLALPWHKLRYLRRWLTKWGIRMGSETKQRQLAQAIAPYPIKAENVLFSFSRPSGGEEFRMAACAYVEDLDNLVTSLLEENTEQLPNGLTWHDGLIPSDEVWVKIGGDKGGGSFKFSLQLANVDHPNSPHNTIVFCAYEGPDTKSNLHIALDRYSDQIKALLQSQWRGKKFVLFVYGDYAFLCTMYGLSGASGRHCCLWCVITHNEMQVAQSQRGLKTVRDLNHLESAYTTFQQTGHNLKKAKDHFNVISPHFLDIPLSQVCIPGLHISLGVFHKLFTLFENSAHQLDILIATTLGHTRDEHQTLRYSFSQYVEVHQRVTRLTEEADELLEHAEFLDSLASWNLLSSDVDLEGEDEENITPDNSNIFMLRREAKDARQKAAEINQRIETIQLGQPFQKEDGPCYHGIEQALADCGVRREAYYSKTFVGNHVHKCCKEEVSRQIVQSIVTVVHQMCPPVEDDAVTIRDRFGRCFSLFASCHNLYNKAERLTEDEITELESNIKTFMEFYRREFPKASVTPKLHMMEDHVVPWIRKWKFGLGFHGEQGAESIHSVFNSLKRTYNNVRSPVERLQRIMREHFLQNSPANLAAKPIVKRRKREK